MGFKHKTDEEMKKLILNILKKHDPKREGMTHSAIAKIAGISHPTICKFALVLEAEGKVKIRQFGTARVTSLA